MGLTRAADLGFGFAMGRAQRTLSGFPSGSGPMIGYTSASIISNDIQAVNIDAARLESLMTANVVDAPLRAAWAAWYADWQAFYEYHQSQFQRFNSLFYSDTLAAQVEAKSRQLAALYADYNRVRNPATPPVPVPNVKQPKAEDAAREQSVTGWNIPWWVWMLGGVAVVGAGYLAYRKAQQLRRVKGALETGVLPGLIGQPLAKAAATRDPGPLVQGSPCASGYEHGIPLSLDEVVAAHPQQSYTYRPYEHPHLIAARDRARRAKLAMQPPVRDLEESVREADPTFFDDLDGPTYSSEYADEDEFGDEEEW
jgi:hypothetical protein